MFQLTPKQVLTPLVIVLTAAHVAVRWSAAQNRQPELVSPLSSGTSVSMKYVQEAERILPNHCLQLVVFSPDCPFCQHAADREREKLTEASRVNRVWYTEKETATLAYFVEQHLHRQPGISAELVKELEVQAVPALFVLTPQGEIRWVGSYTGDEPDEVLAERCSGDRSRGSKDVMSS